MSENLCKFSDIPASVNIHSTPVSAQLYLLVRLQVFFSAKVAWLQCYFQWRIWCISLVIVPRDVGAQLLMLLFLL